MKLWRGGISGFPGDSLVHPARTLKIASSDTPSRRVYEVMSAVPEFSDLCLKNARPLHTVADHHWSISTWTIIAIDLNLYSRTIFSIAYGSFIHNIEFVVYYF